jgi:large repetitive protein
VRSPRQPLCGRLALGAVLVLGSAGVPGVPGVAGAASVTTACAAVTVTAAADADAWVSAGNTSGTGSDSVLTVAADPSGGDSRALVRFRLPAVPSGCVVESARLRLYTPAGTDGARVEAVRLASTWSEGSVRWGNQPLTTGAAAAAWSTDGYLRWTVTAQVRAGYDTGVHHGFLVRDAAEGTDAGGRHGFHSREKGEHPPQLVIRFAPPQTGEPLPPAAPVPTAVRCGQVLTQSTLVTNNLTNCPGDGLVVGAPRIIVDLGGRTVDGVGLGAGVHNDGYPSVTIRNGTVADFDHGVRLLPESAHNVVERLTLRDNQVAAVELFDAADSQVRGNTLARNGAGIHLVNGSTRAAVTGNTVTDTAGEAVFLRDSAANRVEGNTVVGGGDVGIGLERAVANTVLGNAISGTSDGGIELRDGSHDNRVEANTLTHSGDSGILVAESDRTLLVANRSHHMSDTGIGLDAAADSVVRGNDVRFNSTGIEVGGTGNLIEANNASETTGNGIELAPDALDNHIVANTANANSQAGIHLDGEAAPGLGNLIERNTADGNRVDGILVAKGGHTVTANLARNNAKWGINAHGSIDGAGNTATGNGERSQCVGVVCRAEWNPPDTTITSGPPGTTGSVATFSFTAGESGSRFQCALDTLTFTTCTSPRQYTGLAPGTHLFRVRAIDRAGNTDPTPATHTWTVQVPLSTRYT